MKIGDWHEERLADRTETAVSSSVARAEVARAELARAEAAPWAAGLRGEQVMPHRPRAAPAGGEPVPVRTCWMCGIRLPAEQMMADGGSACPDLRWYCRDLWGCTRRWTTYSARLATIRPDPAGTSQPVGEQVGGEGKARPVAV